MCTAPPNGSRNNRPLTLIITLWPNRGEIPHPTQPLPAIYYFQLTKPHLETRTVSTSFPIVRATSNLHWECMSADSKEERIRGAEEERRNDDEIRTGNVYIGDYNSIRYEYSPRSIVAH